MFDAHTIANLTLVLPSNAPAPPIEEPPLLLPKPIIFQTAPLKNEKTFSRSKNNKSVNQFGFATSSHVIPRHQSLHDNFDDKSLPPLTLVKHCGCTTNGHFLLVVLMVLSTNIIVQLVC
jgi:hypothetical protein